MSTPESRRKFLTQGAAATAGLFAAGTALGQQTEKTSRLNNAGESRASNPKNEEFPRMHAGLGGPVGSPTDRGKLVNGFRKENLEPVPMVTPDLAKLPFKMVNGVKEFHLRPMPVQRELLPGQTFHFYGYNNSMPGPTIEVIQGDRVRIVVHNELPEATTVHWHGLECPCDMDGIPFVTQEMIAPGGTFVYEFTVHQAMSMAYHAHVGMQEAAGSIGMFIAHPKIALNPPVDHDFGMLLQQFNIGPNSNVVNTMAMDWNYLTLNGRCGPYTTPLLVRLGSRVRMRFFNFSTLHQHPLHFHGHTGWLTGTEGGRIPETAWTPLNTVRIGIGEIREVEFVANNPGDWVMHCHMFHHTANHMVSQVGPHIRDPQMDEYKKVPVFPQLMQGKMPMNPMMMKKIKGRRETQGMTKEWFKGVKGMMTVIRVLPDELYTKITRTNLPIPTGASLFSE
ncbi:Multicopper oxidase [hydrothermal vent metagenome]|uniref:Multicopper oxidase n=1 Tax=hydrothermal vent metagenome TaxID=652676 RepID=A0A3B1E1Y6_9ZZZZ